MVSARRRFLGTVGSGLAASAGLTGTVAAREPPAIEVTDTVFDPVGLYEDLHATVRFEIAGGTHSATAYSDSVPTEATPLDSGIASGGSFEYTFETSGTDDYHSVPHRSIGMVGRIPVGSAGESAEDTPIPDGVIPERVTIVERKTVSYGSFARGSENLNGGEEHGHGRHWHGSLPFLGGPLGVPGVAGGVRYWTVGSENTEPETMDPTLARLRNRYARGEVDGEEFRPRRARLATDETDTEQ